MVSYDEWLAALMANIHLHGTGTETTDSYPHGMVLNLQLNSGVGLARFVTANEGLNSNYSHILWRSECGHRWKILVSATLQEKCTS